MSKKVEMPTSNKEENHEFEMDLTLTIDGEKAATVQIDNDNFSLNLKHSLLPNPKVEHKEKYTVALLNVVQIFMSDDENYDEPQPQRENPDIGFKRKEA